MTVEEFIAKVEEGNFEEGFNNVIEEGIVSDDYIYQIAQKLEEKEIRPSLVVLLFQRLLENPNNSTKECAFKLILMAFRANNPDLYLEFFVRNIMESIHESMLTLLPEEMKKEVLIFIHCLYCSFSTFPQYCAIVDLYQVMIAEGFVFPKNKQEITLAKTPEWIDDEACSLCMCKFSTFNRKHHCRNCGNVFCSKCTPSSIPLPHYLILKPVRVCEECENKLNSTKTSQGIFGICRTDNFITKEDGSPTPVVRHPGQKSTEESDPFLKRAIEMSLRESEIAKNTRQQQPSHVVTKHNPSPMETVKDNTPVSSAPIYPSLDTIPVYKSLYPSVAPNKLEEQLPSNTIPAVKTADQENDEIIVNNFEDILNKINDKIALCSKGSTSAASNYSLQAMFQAMLGMYNGFVEIREKNNNEIQKCLLHMQKYKSIADARKSLNDLRLMNSKKLQEQQRETEALLRIHMEQKMQFIQQQRMEFDSYHHQLSEQRRRNLEIQNSPQYPASTPFDPLSAMNAPPNQQIYAASPTEVQSYGLVAPTQPIGSYMPQAMPDPNQQAYPSYNQFPYQMGTVPPQYMVPSSPIIQSQQTMLPPGQSQYKEPPKPSNTSATNEDLLLFDPPK